MPKLNLDNPVFRLMSALGDILILNLLWVLCCIPLVTTGASTTALFTVARKLAAGEDSQITKDFFRAFRRNWKTATLMWLPLALAGTLFAADLLIAFQTPGALGNLFRGTGTVLCLLWLATAGNAFALLARYEYKPLRVLLDALMLGISCPASAVTSAATALWLPLLSLLDPGTALYLLPVWLLVAGSVSALALSAVLLPAFRRLEEKSDNSEDKSCQS